MRCINEMFDKDLHYVRIIFVKNLHDTEDEKLKLEKEAKSGV